MMGSPPGVGASPRGENPPNKNSLISSCNWLLISSTVFNITLGQNSKWLHFASHSVCGDTSGVDNAVAWHILVLPHLKGRSAATQARLVLQIGNYDDPHDGVSAGHLGPDFQAKRNTGPSRGQTHALDSWV